jgi:hypothetical protein
VSVRPVAGATLTTTPPGTGVGWWCPKAVADRRVLLLLFVGVEMRRLRAPRPSSVPTGDGLHAALRYR